MTTPQDDRTPEGQLVEAARTNRSPVLSIRKAASMAGISEGWWRQIVKGYRTVKGGVRISVDAPADTLAAMALAVGVTPAELRRIDRGDAAASLELLLQSTPDGWDGDLSAVPDDELIAELDRRLRDRLGETAPPQLRAVARRVDPADRSTFEGD
ncbi:hypothetical protein [Corynebacterium humireducens]|nr:hypothetical protein [Corynebacterium humireducens]